MKILRYDVAVGAFSWENMLCEALQQQQKKNCKCICDYDSEYLKMEI